MFRLPTPASWTDSTSPHWFAACRSPAQSRGNTPTHWIKVVAEKPSKNKNKIKKYTYIHYSTVHYSTLLYITVQYSTLHYSNITVHCSTVQYSKVHYIKLQYITLQYITLHYGTVHYSTLRYSTLQYITLHYGTVHNSTLRYSTLQYSTCICVYIYMFPPSKSCKFTGSCVNSPLSTGLPQGLCLQETPQALVGRHLGILLDVTRGIPDLVNWGNYGKIQHFEWVNPLFLWKDPAFWMGKSTYGHVQ